MTSALISNVILGITSGTLTGLGCALLIVPALVYLLTMTADQAQKTTLSILLAAGVLIAAWTYYILDFVDLSSSACVCISFLIGSLIAAKLAAHISEQMLEKIFGACMFLLSLKIILGK